MKPNFLNNTALITSSEINFFKELFENINTNILLSIKLIPGVSDMNNKKHIEELLNTPKHHECNGFVSKFIYDRYGNINHISIINYMMDLLRIGVNLPITVWDVGEIPPGRNNPVSTYEIMDGLHRLHAMWYLGKTVIRASTKKYTVFGYNMGDEIIDSDGNVKTWTYGNGILNKFNGKRIRMDIKV